MSHKSHRIAALVSDYEAGGAPSHLRCFIALFDQQLFYEAHDVLEDLWLRDRTGPEGAFYKGLIQLAGAFVHVQKHRLGPAAALFRLALNNLAPYPAWHCDLHLGAAREAAKHWLREVENATSGTVLLGRLTPIPLTLGTAPQT
jgi:predicted metal-dependent hydrolase